MEPLKPTIIRQRRRTIALQITPDATLIVKAPFFVPGFMIERFIKEKETWIRSKIAEMSLRPKAAKKQYIDGEEFLYLGESIKLAIREVPSISLKDTTLLFPFRSQRRIQKLILQWYMDNALQVISKRVEKYAEYMDVRYKDIGLSNGKSRWGACTHTDSLTFNWRLIMAPIEVIDYVIVHELAHTKEKNHSRRFWEIVGKHYPTYKMRITWLKRNGNTLEL